jgi:hypothetical protein
MMGFRTPTPTRPGAFAALAASVIVAGCSYLPFSAQHNAPATEVAAAPAFPPPPPHKPPTPGAPGPPGAPATPAVVRLPDAPEPPPPGGFDRLIGLDQPQLTAVLGEPVKRADEAPATIWYYTGQACDLDVYFYFNLESQAMRALHYIVRSHESHEQSAQQCYDELVRERRAGADSAAGTDRPR